MVLKFIQIDFIRLQKSSYPFIRFFKAEQILGLARQTCGWEESSARACERLGTTSFENPTVLNLEGQGKICNSPL